MTILNSQFIYHRKELAEEYCRILSGRSPVNNATSGLFLAAPRRTGKSTFSAKTSFPKRKTWIGFRSTSTSGQTRPATLPNS